jgi:hypothetical protein
MIAMNTSAMTETFSNLFLMLSFQEVDREVWDAFEKGDTETVALCSDLYKELVSDVCKFVPTDKV